MPTDTKTQSVISLYEAMMLAKECNDGLYNWLLNNCGTQSSLAGMSRTSANIEGMTLNTFKKYADENIKGGFSVVNLLRKTLAKKSKPQTVIKKNRLKEQNTDLKNRLEEAERMRAVLLKAYNDLNRITLDAMVSSPAQLYDYQRHRDLYESYFGLKLVADND